MQLGERARYESIEEVYAALGPVMRAVASAVGPHCEVVLHDVGRNDPGHTIYAIENGHVTGRSVGGPSTNLGLAVRSDQAADHDALGYRGRTSDGRALHCSSVYYRNAAGSVIAALCINLDTTHLENIRSLVNELIPETGASSAPPSEIVGPTIDSVLDEMVEAAVESVGRPTASMSKEDRIQVLRVLEERGAFHIKRSVDRVAARLGVSKVTAYGYLDGIRNG